MKTEFTWIGGATWTLAIATKAGTATIACDPVLAPKGTVQDYGWFKARRIEEPAATPADFAAVDLWLLTHAHEDHLDARGIEAIGGGTRVVARANAARKLARARAIESAVLDWGETRDLTIAGLPVRIEAVPAVHGVNPLAAAFAGKVNGYWLTLGAGPGARTVYVTGDTVTHRRVLAALSGRACDLMVANLGAAQQGTWMMALTLNARMLARLRDALRPKRTIPVHFGTFTHYREPIDPVRALGDDSIAILAPGEAIGLDL